VASRTRTARESHASVDVAFDAFERDDQVGGGIIAGALAYRLFIWLLPLALVLVAGLGVMADATSESPRQVARSVGLLGLVSGSVASAAKSPSRWYALVVGISLLLFATSSLLRALAGAHRLVWRDVGARTRPTPAATARLLVLALCFFLVSAGAAAVRARTPGIGVAVTLIAIVPYALLWLAVSARLPHLDADTRALVPGAIVFGIGVEVIHAAAVYVLGPWALSKQGTYGALGLAAALLTGLFLLSRLAVGAAVLNAALWERRT